MKTFTATLALILTATAMMAFPSGSKLTVEIIGHRPNTLILFNGQKYSSMHNTVQLENLRPGEYPVKVLRPSYWGSQGVIFNGVIQVPHRSDVLAKITPSGMKVHVQPLAYVCGNCWNEPAGHCNGGHGGTHPHHRPVLEPVVCPPAYVGMHPDVFAGALRSIGLQSFDSDQIRVAKQVTSRNGASSAQIAEMMKLVSFESSRLEVAKYGFQFVADPENYFIVNDLFWFSSSVSELDRFINGY